MGMGNDQYAQEYAKAAHRTVEDALRHSTIPMFQALEPSLSLTSHDIRLQVTIGAQGPDLVDTQALISALPHGRTEVTAVGGGLNVVNPGSGNVIVIASAAVEAFLPYLGGQA